MKTLLLVLALSLVCCAAFAATETAQMDVYDNWSFIGLPIVPITSSYPNTATIFSGAGLDIEYTGLLSKLDAPTGNTLYYEAWNPGTGDWSMLLGEGYYCNFPAGTTSNPTAVVYTGVQDGVPDADGTMTDMWISLPGNQLDGVNAGGWHWISCPFNHPVPFNGDFWDGAKIKVTDGNTVRTLLDASSVAPIWIDEPWTYLDGASQNGLYAGYMTGVYDSDQLEPGKAYAVKTRVDNLALIIPAY